MTLRTLVPRPWQLGLCCFVCGVVLLFLGVILGGGTQEHVIPVGTIAIGLGTLSVGTITAIGALGQLKVARQRHEEQTKADLRRRITESFTKAVEQLGSDKLEVRLGGIYTLERISEESADDYWPIMETLTAFVREHAGWKKGDESTEAVVYPREDELGLHPERGPPTDIVAVLTVIGRRSVKGRARENDIGLHLDLRNVDLRFSTLHGAHLEKVDLRGVHLEGSDLTGTYFEGAVLSHAHLERADLRGANLVGADLAHANLKGSVLLGTQFRGANLISAHLEEVTLLDANLEGANLGGTSFEGASLIGAYLKGAILRHANLKKAFLLRAFSA